MPTRKTTHTMHGFYLPCTVYRRPVLHSSTDRDRDVSMEHAKKDHLQNILYTSCEGVHPKVYASVRMELERRTWIYLWTHYPSAGRRYLTQGAYIYNYRIPACRFPAFSGHTTRRVHALSSSFPSSSSLPPCTLFDFCWPHSREKKKLRV